MSRIRSNEENSGCACHRPRARQQARTRRKPRVAVRLIARWLPLLTVAAGVALEFSAIPRHLARPAALLAFGLVVSVVLALEGRDKLAARRPGAMRLASACDCQYRVASAEAEVAELRAEVDRLQAWAADLEGAIELLPDQELPLGVTRLPGSRHAVLDCSAASRRAM